MRYPLAGRETLQMITGGGGVLAGAAGLAAYWSRRAFLPLAVPLAVGGGLMWLGRNMGDAFVDVGDTKVRVKLGVLFDETIDLTDIARVKTAGWNILGGLGVRTNFKDMVAVVTRTGQVADIRFWRPLRLPVIPKVLHVDAQRLLVSPDHLDSFLTDLRGRLSA
ncbi:MAG: hypothetical protein GWN99_07285 [Gemmatimonadetes bacterium]|uniref:Uncharacterized protein n=1 Tax=Candidatus Kutchimonas denitrificans TaxID=3056748 RepID=A0AAE4Z963_9BACT|nr:hypothetical protein [Gemmatimonadota bacterium]NIR74466.1 hypothetical protein [Candidatus Kutchimonas denitrificans]NIS00862.1 hypothetical protein [Gemmatimonadota bacterium]NIT66485.1 hypothetical protein [Gemmatimonadota bacterium]NIU52116.1 hypothetical protein [Gemmatimonadota bacterium]